MFSIFELFLTASATFLNNQWVYREKDHKCMTEDEKLIKECIKGSAKAQKKLYDIYAPRMYAVSLRYSKTTFEADDILQESFLKVFDNISNFKNECPLLYWIKRIVINTALKTNRKLIDKAHKEDVHQMIAPPNEEIILSDYNFQDLLTMIRKLPTGYQVVFNLYAIEGYKHKEIADLLGISEGTSKSQYARAKLVLQEMIQKEQKKYENR